MNEFVRKEVLPLLDGQPVPAQEAVARIREFLGGGRPYMVSHGLSPENDDHVHRLGIDMRKFRVHHALDDARLLRELYLHVLDGKL